jgi:hypothetical protein
MGMLPEATILEGLIMYMIKAVEFVDGSHTPFAGEYLKSYDPDARDGVGLSAWTSKKDEAMKFASGGEALECWRQVSKVRPVRRDGKPNRPLTSITVELVRED